MLFRSQKWFVRLLVLSILFAAVTGYLFYSQLVELPYLLLALAFTTLVNVIYYVAVFRPFSSVIGQIEAMLAGQKYHKILVNSKDEFGLLGHFFNQVTTDLEAVAHDLEEGDRRASELNLAAEIQRSILPVSVPEIKGLEICARTRPAEEVGGDSFGFMQNGSQHFIYLGDVTGHGAPAGLVMMMVNTLLTVFAPTAENSKDLMVRTNYVLKPRVNSTMFMTTIVLRWDEATQQLYYTGAGHEHILIYRAREGVCEAIVTGGIALGMIDDIAEVAEEKLINLQPEDIVVLYTDGIPEARNYMEELFELNRLKLAVAKYGPFGSADKMFNGIAEELRTFVGEEPQLDDITLIVLKKSGAGLLQQSALNQTAW